MSLHKNILNRSGSKLTDEVMRAYFAGELSEAEQHEVEQWLADTGMEADALEGLQNMQIDELNNITKNLNLQLERHIRKQPRRRSKPIKDNYWAWVAVIIILLLCIAAYMLMRLST